MGTLQAQLPVKQHGFVVANCILEEESDVISTVSMPAVYSGGLKRDLKPIMTCGESLMSSSVKTRECELIHAGVSPGLANVNQGDVALAEYSHLTPGVKRMMRSVVRGLKAYQDPEAATEGLGGTYFFKSEGGTKIAIMKPCDEEPLAPNNPKGFVGRRLGEPGLKPTVRVGEAASREVAAYLLDHDRFAKVPHTVMVRMSHPIFHYAMEESQNTEPASHMPSIATPDVPSESAKNDCHSSCGINIGGNDDGDEDDCDEEDDGELPLKLGSLQGFVPHDCDTSEIGTSRFNMQDVHRIGILDIRLFNTDRHAGNILVRRVRHSMLKPEGPMEAGLHDQYELIPIDHGFALPEGLEPPYFEWQHWPQAMMPFDEEELNYIANLDAKADAELLRRELPGIRESSLRVMELATLLLQKCAAGGLSLSEIAGIVTRPLIGIEDEPSELEKLCFEVRREMFKDQCTARNADFAIAQGACDAMSSMSISEAADGSVSPGSESAGTHFNMSLDGTLGSDASKIDDALFSMDEDGGGLRTPAPGSPASKDRRDRAFAAAPSLRVRPSGKVETPQGNLAGTTFKSALNNADSLPPSYDSDSPTQGNEMSAFRGARSLAPGFTTTCKKSEGQGFNRSMSRSHLRGSNMDLADPDMDISSGRPQYPPMVEPRGCAESSQLLNDLSFKEWEDFLGRIAKKVNDGIKNGIWRESPSSRGQVQQMSCPRF